MQEATDGIQRFVDARGGRWRALGDARDFLESVVAPWLEPAAAGAPDVPLKALKRSKRREVYEVRSMGLPPLLLKRYPPRRGLLGRGRDRIATRAASELRMARKLAERGLATPRALGCREPPGSSQREPSWFVSQLLIGASTLGSWLEARFVPDDRAPAKLALARRALDELARLHAAGIWHRDFHGGNLLLHEGEGPAARLYFIDLHAAIDLGLPLVPALLRERDAADLLHSLRRAFSTAEVATLVDDAERWRLDRARLAAALAAKREGQARSRGARAFVESSRFAQARLETADGAWNVSHDRSLELAAIGAALAAHRGALVRAGTRSRISVARGVVVKELLGPLARRKARAAFGNAVAAQARDLPVAAPLACVTGKAGEPAFVLAREVDGGVPLHLLAQRTPRDERERGLVAAVARSALELLAALVQRRFVHPDLSPKNLLVRVPGGKSGDASITLVDLDPAKPGAGWSRRRLLRALAQLGDVPVRTFSSSQRLRFLRELGDRLGLEIDLAQLARATGRKLRRRQKLDPRGAPAHELESPRTLHLFGNWKWTGPAEPAVAIAAALAPSSRLLLGRCPHPDLGQPVQERAAARGVPHVLLEELRKHWNPLRTGAASSEAMSYAGEHAPAAIHVHLDGDHAIAKAVARSLPRPVALIRHVHAAGPHAARTRGLLRSAQLLVAPSFGLARALEQELALPELDVATLETSVDLGRFRFEDEARARGRERLGLAREDVAFGIVARIQSHRRFELLLDAWTKLAAAGGAPKLVILGRGTREDELVREPVRARGLEKLVLLPGYQEGQAYVDALAACDAGVFLVPGTDVSCRAVREWMTMGRPVLASKRAPLPELVEDGVDGKLVDEDAEALARAARDMSDRGFLAKAGASAGSKARRRFDPAWLRASLLALDRMAAFALPGMAARFRAGAGTTGGVVAAVRPGRLDAVLRFVQREGLDPERVLALDPRRSRDAAIDLAAIVREVRPPLVLLEPHPELDLTLTDELRRAAPETLLFAAPTRAARAAAEASPLARRLAIVEG